MIELEMRWSGLLWYDDDADSDLITKVKRAATAYKKKHGHKPSVCYVHLSVIEKDVQIGTVLVKPLRSVLRHHFWLGVEEEGEGK